MEVSGWESTTRLSSDWLVAKPGILPFWNQGALNTGQQGWDRVSKVTPLGRLTLARLVLVCPGVVVQRRRKEKQGVYNTEGIEEHKLMNKKKKKKYNIDNALIFHIPGIHTWLAASRQPE